MPDFLLELRSEEIPARMQARARADLERLFTEELAKAGLKPSAIRTFATPRRLALIARELPEATEATTEERRGPRADAPAQALDGFLKSTGLTRDQLEEREDKKGARVLFAVISRPGRPTRDVLAEAMPAVIRGFPWPKSMRWGEPSISTESSRWVRPLQGIVALFGEELVPVEAAGVHATAWTLGHRVHHPGPITLGGAHDYEAKLRACHVILDSDERARIITEGARALAAERGLTLVEDEALAAENAGLTEWPVPLMGGFDPAYLQVPREVIQLTMRTNQKYFSLLNPPRDGEVAARSADGGGAAPGATPPPPSGFAGRSPSPSRGGLAPAFICVANIEAPDGGEAITRGNERVLAARLSDARFFWEQDLKVPLEEQAEKLGQIVFHEKLGTVADKVERVARLARWLVKEGIVTGAEQQNSARVERSRDTPSPERLSTTLETSGGGLSRDDLAALATRAARLAKADLVTGTVGEFPEVQGIAGGHIALAQGEHPAVAAAIRDHYKPVGQGGEVPTDPVTVAVALADKMDSIVGFFSIDERPTGSKDPFALRRAALGIIEVLTANGLRVGLDAFSGEAIAGYMSQRVGARGLSVEEQMLGFEREFFGTIPTFFADRLKVQQREAGVRHDLIDAVFALGGEDDIVRLLARVRALQAFMGTEDGANLHIAYKRAANILKKEGWDSPETAHVERSRDTHPSNDPSTSLGTSGNGAGAQSPLSYTPSFEEQSLITALDSAEPRAKDAVQREEFEAAMSALASLRAPIDAFFDRVTVNDPDPDKRAARLALLARFRDAVRTVADFSRIEGHASGGDAA